MSTEISSSNTNLTCKNFEQISKHISTMSGAAIGVIATVSLGFFALGLGFCNIIDTLTLGFISMDGYTYRCLFSAHCLPIIKMSIGVFGVITVVALATSLIFKLLGDYVFAEMRREPS